MADPVVYTLDSKHLGKKRKVRLWTPPGFSDSPGKKWPLLIQQDGQLAFSERDADLPYGSWGLDQWIERLSADPTFRPPVVIGVDNSPQRMREYFPLTEEFRLYERFLLEELLPWAEEQVPLSGERALMGSSMGGLVSFALAANNPGVFAAAACVSPWFEYENNRYIHDVLREVKSKPPIRVYMDSGIHDWRGLDDGHRGMLLARLELIRLGFIEGYDLFWTVDPWFPTHEDLKKSKVRASHHENALTNQHNEFQWSRRLERPLRFLFGSSHGI